MSKHAFASMGLRLVVVVLLPLATARAETILIDDFNDGKFGRMAAQYWVESDKAAEAELEKAGIKVVQADPKFEAALIKIGDDLTKQWIETANKRGLNGQATYDFYVNRVKELSKKN